MQKNVTSRSTKKMPLKILSGVLDNLQTVTAKPTFLTSMIHTRIMRGLTIITSLLLIGIVASTAKSQTQAKDLESREFTDKAVSSVTRKRVASLPDPKEALKNAKTILVKSTSLLVGTSVIEDKLKKRREFQALGLLITRDVNDADLILEVEHDLFTMYTYTVIDSRSQVLVASGKLSSLGGTVAGKVAERFMKQMLQAKS